MISLDNPREEKLYNFSDEPVDSNLHDFLTKILANLCQKVILDFDTKLTPEISGSQRVIFLGSPFIQFIFAIKLDGPSAYRRYEFTTSPLDQKPATKQGTEISNHYQTSIDGTKINIDLTYPVESATKPSMEIQFLYGYYYPSTSTIDLYAREWSLNPVFPII